ncbi:primosomal protein DnaI [Streptococcus sp. zg-JUN1979]|uniref:primosomal protein DnaI n=1 Tax=Streptococcus sp. zg-JUN1979 TaxID=3391450 RepID=UPI0039A4F3FA
MKSISDAMPNYKHASMASVEETILKHPQVAAFINHHQLTAEQIKISLSKFNQFITESQKFESNDKSYVAKGYQPILVMNEGYADVSYQETKGLIQTREANAILDRIHLVNLPRSYRDINLALVDGGDDSRLVLMPQLMDFIEHYPNVRQGLYLYGDMGIGKTYMMAALAYELSKRRQVETMLLHFPSFALDVKNAISNGSVKDEIDKVKVAPVLIIDDIGAEQSTSWVRDEVLQVILQYRMTEELPTFFTSNYSFSDLEQKWASIRGADETWQARRVMERVRYLAKEFHLKGRNRRQE